MAIKILFVYDIFRICFSKNEYENIQLNNISWLKAILFNGFSNLKNNDLESKIIEVTKNDNRNPIIFKEKFYYKSYQDKSESTWAKLYEENNIELILHEKILSQLIESDYIIGFEMPPSIRKMLNRLGKKFINFYIHPIRFMRDLAFHITTNSLDASIIINTCKVSSDEIHRQVNRYQALFAHKHQEPSLLIPSGLPIFIGQTENDAVLIKNKKFNKLTDHEKKLRELLLDYEEIIFLQHPYSKTNKETIEYTSGK